MQKSLGTMDIDGERAGWKERARQVIVEHEWVSAFFCVITVRVEKGIRFNSQRGMNL